MIVDGRVENTSVDVVEAGPDARPPLLDAGSMHMWRQFLRSHASVVRGLESELEEAHGMQLASYDVLVQLADSPDGLLRMSELAEAVLLSRSGLTRLVDRLVRDGLVERRSCPSDARGTFAVLTPAGRERLRAASATHLRGVVTHVTSKYSSEERAQLADLLGRLVVAGPSVGACGADA